MGCLALEQCPSIFGRAASTARFRSTNPIITDSSHAIINGPFGTVGSIGHASEGSIDDLGQYALEIASNMNGSSIAYIPPGSLGTGSGPVVLFSDINEFTSNDTPWGPGFDREDNRVLFKNLFAYLAQVCSVSVQGDANGNGIVDIADLRLVAASLNTKPPADPRADLNDDGKVDMSDLTEVAVNFGRTSH